MKNIPAMFLMCCNESSQAPRTIFTHARLLWGNWRVAVRSLTTEYSGKSEELPINPGGTDGKCRSVPPRVKRNYETNPFSIDDCQPSATPRLRGFFGLIALMTETLQIEPKVASRLQVRNEPILRMKSKQNS